MTYTLQTGLDDLSAVLNESSTITSTARKTHYNEAVQEFARRTKWPFLIKIYNTTTVANQAEYALPSDIREPGGIIEVLVGTAFIPPVEFANRDQADNYWYILPEYTNRKLVFTTTPEANLLITMRYFSIPARVTEPNLSFPLPDFVRRPIALLAGEYVSRAKRQSGTANNLRELYNQAVDEIQLMQSERASGMPKRFGLDTRLFSFRRKHGA